jgi:hypothetical protein
MENLRKLVGEELYKQIADKIGEGIENYHFVKDGDYVPRSRIKELQDEAKAKTSEYESRIAELGKAKENEIIAIKRDYEIEKALSLAGARNSKATRALLDESKITYKDGTIAGLSEEIERIRKSDDYLFNGSEPSKATAPNFGTPIAKQTNTKSDFELTVERYQQL